MSTLTISPLDIFIDKIKSVFLSNQVRAASTRIIFTGAHRAGKTTLAKAIAASTGIPFIDCSARQSIGELSTEEHLSVKGNGLRALEIQERIWDSILEKLKINKGSVVADRGPVDVIAYNEHLMNLHNDPAITALFKAHSDKIKKDFRKLLICDTLETDTIAFYVPPLPFFNVDEKSASEDIQVSVDTSVSNNLSVYSNLDCYLHCIPDTMVDLDWRVKFCKLKLDRTY